MEIYIIEGAITLIIKHILIASKKLPISFFMKFAEFEDWMNALVHSVKVFKSGSSLVF